MPEITLAPELITFLWFLPFLFFSLAMHEFAHAYAAYKMGDETAYRLGRMTLNPLKHLDVIGSVVMPLLSFASNFGLIGWAKPVPVTPINFRKPRRDDIIVSAAGPVMNLLLAFVCALLTVILINFRASFSLPQGLISALINYGIGFNVFLCFFNLLPIPPLDGSHILYAAFPNEVTAKIRRGGWIGLLILMIFINSPLWSLFMMPVKALSRFIISLTGVI